MLEGLKNYVETGIEMPDKDLRKGTMGKMYICYICGCERNISFLDINDGFTKT